LTIKIVPILTRTAAATDPEAAAKRLRYLQDKEEADFQRAMALSIEEETRDKYRREAYDKHVDNELHSNLGVSFIACMSTLLLMPLSATRFCDTLVVIFFK
jgi:hypothetical protein